MIRKLYAYQLARVLSLLWIIIFIPGAGNASATLYGVNGHSRVSSSQLADKPNFFCAGGENRFEIPPGETATLQLSLEDAQIYNAFQTDITLPAGLTLTQTDDKPDITLAESGISSSHIITTAGISSGHAYRVVVYSLKNEAFVNGENLLSLRLMADTDFEGGEITISNTILTLTDETDLRFDPMTIEVVPYIPPTPPPFPDDFSLNPTVSRTKIREGGVLGLYATMPEYGYADGWTCEWTEGDVVLTDLPEYNLTVGMTTPGDRQSTETRVFTFHALNYTPEGDTWAQFVEDAPEVTVYRAPETPRNLVIKGDGTSKVLIAMFTLSDEELTKRNYHYVFGYDDVNGERRIVSSSGKRYSRYDDSIFSDNSLRKWCYTEWDYPDGSTVSSGLCYLDGITDEDFDASVFDNDGETRHIVRGELPSSLYNDNGQWILNLTAESETHIEIFTVTGLIMFKRVIPGGGAVSINLDSQKLSAGINIVRISSNSASSCYKIYR